MSLHAHIFHMGGAEAPLFFFMPFDTEIDTTTLYVRISATPVRVRPTLPADKIPRKTLYLAFCGAFVMSVCICLGMEFGTLRRLFARIPNAHHRGRDGKLSALHGACSNHRREEHMRRGCFERGDNWQRNDGVNGRYTADQFRVVPVWR